MLSLKGLKEYGKHETFVNASKIEYMVKGIRATTKHWNESNRDWDEKMKKLQQDIRNTPYHHIFGQQLH